MGEIIVIGSINMDLVVRTKKIPAAGETIPGQEFRLIPGGKGANQAVAASKLGGNVSMVGCVGNDAFGPSLCRSLVDQGVNTEYVFTKDSLSTGTATIIVEDSGENRIIVVAGANGAVDKNVVEQVKELIVHSKALVLQFEIPTETVEYAINLAYSEHIPVFLNPAPVYAVSDDLLSKVDYLIVNESEAYALTDISVCDLESAKVAANQLREKGVKVVVVTLGKNGAWVASESVRLHVPAKCVEVIDTTAAGDTFVGALAVSLVNGFSLEEAVRFSVNAGTLAVTKLGAQPSIPTQEEVNQFISMLSK